MIERLRLLGIEVYVTRFTADELAMSQADAQKKAVSRLLSHLFGQGVELCHRPDGSPFLEGCEREISISHCRGYAALAAGSRKRIGVDIETPRATLRRVIPKFLSSEESVRITADDDLLRAWTVKEALYKAAGVPGVDFANDVTLPVGDGSVGSVNAVSFNVASVTLGQACLSVAVKH